jgi:hypothetical protein
VKLFIDKGGAEVLLSTKAHQEEHFVRPDSVLTCTVYTADSTLIF